MGRVFVVLILALVAYFVWRATQGTDVPDAPDAPSVDLPDIDPEAGAKKGADWMASLPPWVWNFAVPMVIVIAALVFLKKKYPAVFWIGIGVGVCVFAIYAMGVAPS